MGNLFWTICCIIVLLFQISLSSSVSLLSLLAHFSTWNYLLLCWSWFVIFIFRDYLTWCLDSFKKCLQVDVLLAPPFSYFSLCTGWTVLVKVAFWFWYKFLMSIFRCTGMPLSLSVIHRTSWSIQSNALLQSIS